MLNGPAFAGGQVGGNEPGDRREGIGEGIASSYRKAGPYIDASWQLAGAVGAGTLAGWWLDKKLGTGPWLPPVVALRAPGAIWPWSTPARSSRSTPRRR